MSVRGKGRCFFPSRGALLSLLQEQQECMIPLVNSRWVYNNGIGGFDSTMEDRHSATGDSTTPLVVRRDGLGNESFIPHLFTSVPALNEAATYLSETTSYLGRCFSNFVEEAPSEDLDRTEQESVPLASIGSHVNNLSPSQSFSTSLSPPATTNIAPAVNGVNSSTGSSNQDTNEQMTSTSNSQNGTSMFQSLVSRARKTILGSAKDIGWLQRDSRMPPVEDGTHRFTELLGSIRNGEHKLPNSVVYLLVPGLFSNHGPLYFVTTKTYFSKMGLACHIVKIHSEASVEKNAREIKEYIEEIYWGARKRVMLLGHSKGGVDAAAALSMYWPDLKDKVAGLALAQSPYGGSPIASDILREGQLGDYVQMRKLMEIFICKVIKGDLQALEDLTYERRREFLRKYQLPRELPVVSFHTEASIGPGVLATMSHVAHAELPLAPGQPAKLPVIIPLPAALAACAQLLLVRYGEKSDGLVTRRDAEVPGSVVVRPDRKMDHAWMVYSSLNNASGEGDASQVCEALLTLVVEAGHKRRHEIAMKND